MTDADDHRRHDKITEIINELSNTIKKLNELRIDIDE